MAQACPLSDPRGPRAGAPQVQRTQAFALSVEEAEAHGPVAGIPCLIFLCFPCLHILHS